MQIELHCPGCLFHFSAPPDAAAAEILNQMIEEGPWLALGRGETFEDMIFAALTSRGKICCPDCQEPLEVSEESLGRYARELFPCI
jgi:hypothetical protein